MQYTPTDTVGVSKCTFIQSFINCLLCARHNSKHKRYINNQTKLPALIYISCLAFEWGRMAEQ